MLKNTIKNNNNNYINIIFKNRFFAKFDLVVFILYFII